MTESRGVIPIHTRQPAAAGAAPEPQPSPVEERVGSDPVTRLPNRMAFDQAFARIGALRRSAPGLLTMAIFDVDAFRALHEQRGERAGHTLLRRVGDTLRLTLRRSDLLARWEGDRFVALLPNTDHDGAVRAAEKALQSVHAEQYALPDGSLVQVTLSAGVAAVASHSSLDVAMETCSRYVALAKIAGRARVLSAQGEVIPKRTRVLLLEDDEPSASVIIHRLTRAGCEVLRVRTSAEVMAQAANDSPSLILLDLNAAEADGFGLLERLRARPALEGVPIVALSHVQSEKEMIRGFHLGMDDFILKPFSTDELVARVQRLLKRSR